MKKMLLFIFLIFISFNIDALSYTTYDNSITTVNNYINKYSDRNKYLIFNTKYDFNNTSPIVNNSFTHGGLLSKKEFETTIVNDRSYLSNGREYWTITPVPDSNLQYYVDASLLSKSRAENSGIRVTEFVKREVKVDGEGTFINPWIFRKEFSIHVKSESSEYGNITSGADQMVASGKTSSEIIVNEKAGYVYASDDCGFSKTRSIDNFSNGFEIKNVTHDIECVVHFKVREVKVNYNCNGGSGSTPSQTIRYGTSYTLNTSGCTKEGYTQTGWVTEDNHSYSLGQSGTWGYANGQGGVVSNRLSLKAVWQIDTPATPTIVNSATKVYNHAVTRLTCATNSTYVEGTKKYYSFGYATTSDGTPDNWTTPSDTDYIDVPKNEYRGTRYYFCRVYAKDSTQTSTTTTSDTNAIVAYVNARVDFDPNGGTISGTSPIYVSYDSNSKYTTRTGIKAASIPSATLAGYSFDGWYTAASGGSKVIDKNGNLIASVSGWTNSSSKFILTKSSDSANTNKLYARYIDETGPSVTITAYKQSDDTLVKAAQTFTGTGNTYITSDSWLNYNVKYIVESSDPSGVKKIEHKWNSGGHRGDALDPADDLPTTINETLTSNLASVTDHVEGEGYRRVLWTVYDNLNHKTEVEIIVKIDKTAPKMSTTLYDQVGSDTYRFVIYDDLSGFGSWVVDTGACDENACVFPKQTSVQSWDKNQYYKNAFENKDDFKKTTRCTSKDNCTFQYYIGYVVTINPVGQWRLNELCDRADNCVTSTEIYSYTYK